MALSEHERRLLQQLEESLTAEDPKLAETLRGTAGVRVHRRRATLAGLGFVAGMIVLIAGLQVHPAVSIGGFVLMLASAIIGMNSWQVVSGDRPRPPKPSEGSTKPSSQDFLEKLEERWRQRGDDTP